MDHRFAAKNIRGNIDVLCNNWDANRKDMRDRIRYKR